MKTITKLLHYVCFLGFRPFLQIAVRLSQTLTNSPINQVEQTLKNAFSTTPAAGHKCRSATTTTAWVTSPILLLLTKLPTNLALLSSAKLILLLTNNQQCKTLC